MLKKIWYLIPLLFISITCLSQESKKLGIEEAKAVLVPGSGTYSRKISTQNSQAQVFFDQGADVDCSCWVVSAGLHEAI